MTLHRSNLGIASLLIFCLLAPSLAFAGRPALPTLAAKEQARLDEGKLVLLSKAGRAEGERMVTGLIKVDAPAALIWKIVLSNAHIAASSKAVQEVTTYHDKTVGGVRDLRLAYLLKVGWTEIRYHSARKYRAAEQYLTWVLDKDKPNDIEWTQGSYSTWPAANSGSTIFLYEAQIETGKAIPKWLEEHLTESSLKKYLVYIKDVAER
jgi:hypothetical protein